MVSLPTSLQRLGFEPFCQKSWPQQGPLAAHASLDSQHIQALRLTILGDEWPYPLAVLRHSALDHNIQWMQRYADRKGVWLAPHAKTTMAPKLFDMQLKGGVWGLTFANVSQMAVGVRSGARRVVIANQVLTVADLDALVAWRESVPDLQAWFLVDSLAQLALIDQWHARRQPGLVLDVLLEIGFVGGRTGCRTVAQAVQLANAIHHSQAVRLCGLECYEGGLAHCDSQADSQAISQWITIVQQAATAIDALGHFEGEQVLLSAGGSAVFDLVLPLLCHTRLSQPVQGVLRSGCTLTHDHYHYKRYFDLLAEREQLADGLRPALEVWAVVQSVPEPGLALLGAGRRDLSFDVALPQPVRHIPYAQCIAPDFHLNLNQDQVMPKDWHISALNDHHAYLTFDPDGPRQPQVGDRVALGISHPCTTFDKWPWLALVDDHGALLDVVTTYF